MYKHLIPVVFTSRKEPHPSKVARDGKIMYEKSLYVIVLDEQGTVVEAFENPPFTNPVDCITVLSPVIYKGVLIQHSVVLEIGLRRTSPYTRTEYRSAGSRKRGPRIRTKDKQNSLPPPVRSREVRGCVNQRTPAFRLSDSSLLALLPELCKALECCITLFLETWERNNLLYKPNKNAPHSYSTSITARVVNEERLLCAAILFEDLRGRMGEERNLGANARYLKRECGLFMKANKRSLTEQGDYLHDTVKRSHRAQSIADFLKVRILYYGYSLHMIQAMLSLVGRKNSSERRLLDQIQKVHKVPAPLEDPQYQDLHKTYGALRRALRSSFKLHVYVNKKRAKKRTEQHGKGTFVFSVSLPEGVLAYILQRRDLRKDSTPKRLEPSTCL
jgi:hypothetical protein